MNGPVDHPPSMDQIRSELIEGAPDAIYTLDAQGRILSANAAAAAVVGYPQDQLTGRSVLDVIAPEDRERTARRIRSRFTAGDHDEPFVVDIIDRSGRRRTMEVTSRLIHPAGDSPRLEGFARDITDRKRADTALRTLAAMTAQGRGEDFFRSLVRSVAEALRVRHAQVGVVRSESTHRVEPLAIWNSDGFAENDAFDLALTPGNEILRQDLCLVPDNVRSRFPDDPWLAQIGAESYLALRLTGPSDELLGLLVLAHTGPFDPNPTQLDMLRILAARAGAEIARLRATEALRASEERFRQLAEQARDVLWTLDLPSHRFAYLSPSFQRITGLDTDAFLPHARRVLRLIDRRDRRRVLETLREARHDPANGYAMEYRIPGPHGSERWIFDQGVVIRDTRGLPVRISGVAREITSRKLAEIALATERSRFRELFENSPDAIFVESLEGVVLDVNQAACNLHGMPRDALVGLPVAELVPPHLRTDAQKDFQRLASGELGLCESFSLRRDGSAVPVELRATRVALHHSREALLIHVRDISARRRTEEFLAGQNRILEWIATGRPVEEVLAELVRVTEARQQGVRCWILWFPLGSPGQPAILAPTFRPAARSRLLELATPPGRIGQLLAEARGNPLVIGKFPSEMDPDLQLASIEGASWECTAILPIMARNAQLLGAFVGFLPAGLEPDEPLLDLHRLAASLADVAIERHLNDAALREGATRLHRANAALLELARSELVAHGDLGASLREITEAAARGVGVARVNIWLFEQNDTTLRCVSQFEARGSESDVNLELRVANFPAYFESVTRDRFVSISDVETDPRTRELLVPYLRPLGITSLLDAGIRLRGRLIGMICLEHLGPRRTWKNEEELFAGSIADIVALAIQAGERRCIEEALRQSEEAYRSVVGALAEGVMLVNRDGSFVTFNDSAAEILGLTADYLRNHRLTDVSWDTLRLDGSQLDQEDYPGITTLRTGELVNDAVMGVRRPDGRLVWISVNSRPFSRDESGQVSSVVVSFADITRRQEAERALREGHELLQAVSDVQASFIEDPEPARAFRHVLSRLMRMTDSRQGVIAEVTVSPSGTRELNVFVPCPPKPSDPPDTPSIDDGLRQLIENVLATARPVIMTAPNPRDHLLGLPLRHDEEVVGVVGLSRQAPPFDHAVARRLEPLLITCANLIGAMRLDRQREQAEAQIRQLNAQLEQRVEERTADLRSTNEELAEFAYVVTHDLKAPLRGIHQLSEWLTQDHASRLDPEGLRLLGLLRGRVKHLQHMIDGLLACAKVARTPEPESQVSTLQLVTEVSAVLAPPPNVAIQPAPDLPTLTGNPDRLYQVFQNLIDNAVKYLDKPQGVISISATRRRNAWEFRVADNGPGIPERYQEKVFQIFQRLDPSGLVPGTGLGLTLVKRIVETRGGRIWIESKDGQGAAVCFTWPDRARRRVIA
ncbi:MAG: PAS domain S-box protein [Verrucomicrobiae bacterium]|nr:PAS domain S-box protein [Verrucomicrobiae bacterium]